MQMRIPDFAEYIALGLTDVDVRKLLKMFGSEVEVIAYLKRYHLQMNNNKKRDMTINDSVNVELPEKELSTVWHKIIAAHKPQGPDDAIMQMLPFANQIKAHAENPNHLAAITKKIEDELRASGVKENFIKSSTKSKIATIIPISEKTPLAYLKYFAGFYVYERSLEHPTAAAEFFFSGREEESFNAWLDLKLPDNDLMPEITIKGDSIHKNYSKFTLSKLARDSHEAALLGIYTHNCQAMGEAGEWCVIQGITNPRSCFYVIRNTATNEIVAQTWSWKNRKGELVFDSIEPNPKYNKKASDKQMVTDFYMMLADYLAKQYGINTVSVGEYGGTPDALYLLKPITNAIPYLHESYDSASQWVIAKKNISFLSFYKKKQPQSLLNVSDEAVQLDKYQSIELVDMYLTTYDAWDGVCEDNVQLAIDVTAVADRIESTNLFLNQFEKLSDPSLRESALSFIESVALENKANIKIRDSNGNSVLYHAVLSGSVDAVKRLMRLGLPATERDEELQMTLLHRAALKGHEEVCMYLLMHGGINICAKACHDLTLLHCVIESGNADLVRCFLGHPLIARDVNAQTRVVVNDGGSVDGGYTAMHFAAQAGSLEIVKVLLASGACFDIRDAAGKTVFHSAESYPVLSFLYEQGACITNSDQHHFFEVLSERLKQGGAITELEKEFFADCLLDRFVGEVTPHIKRTCLGRGKVLAEQPPHGIEKQIDEVMGLNCSAQEKMTKMLDLQESYFGSRNDISDVIGFFQSSNHYAALNIAQGFQALNRYASTLTQSSVNQRLSSVSC